VEESLAGVAVGDRHAVGLLEAHDQLEDVDRVEAESGSWGLSSRTTNPISAVASLVAASAVSKGTAYTSASDGALQMAEGLAQPAGREMERVKGMFAWGRG
jgi:hypothetical protein